jgi:NADH-quinone oxidoreductase subunit J
MPVWLFIFLGVLTLISSFGVIVQRNPVHCLLALVFTLVLIAALFIGLGAVTLGLLQAIVYVGAILVLFLFVIWLLNLQAEAGPVGHLGLKLFGAVAVAALVAELFVFMTHIHPELTARPMPPAYGSLQSLASTLFADYLMAFEVTSILLLVAVVGAVAIAHRSGGQRTGSGAKAAKGGAVQ